MIVLVSLVPLYIFIARQVSSRALHAPALPLDDRWPLIPAWALVYGSLYLFLIVLPVFVVRQPEHIRRTVFAYLMVWTTAYICFLIYPTVAPRPPHISGQGFGFWGLEFLYAADPPYNCFPSLHVAHSFVSAFTCYRVHRRLGVGATIAAGLVGVSTLFTKQHYVLDVIAGVLLAGVAYILLLRKVPTEDVPELDRRLAPVLAFLTIGIVCVGFGAYWIAFLLNIHA